MDSASLAAPARTFPVATGARVRTAGVAPLLALLAPLALLAVVLAIAVPWLTTQDLWLTLVSGRELAAHGLPGADHLTLLASGHRWVDQQWLAQLLLFGAARLGGLGLAYAVCLLAILAAFGLAALVAYRRGASPVALLVFLVWALVQDPWGLQLRAQALALPLFSLTLWLLARDPRAERRETLLVLPALCLWANLHGSVVIGVALVLAYALRTRRPAYLLAPAAVLASPYALALPGYYRTMLLDPPFGRAIQEWHRTTPSPLTACFFALLAAAVVLVLVRRRRLALFDLLALALALVVALDALRGLVWFGLAALAFLPALATRRPGTARLEGRAASASAALALVVVAGALALVAARPGRVEAARFPGALPGVVAARAGGGVLANEATADWLLWRLPSLRGRLGYDVRFELLTPAQMRELVAWRQLSRGWQALPGRYGLVVDDPRHVDRLVATGRWRRLFASGGIAVAERVAHVG